MSFIDRDDLYKNYLHPEMESDEQLEDLEFN